MKITFLATAAAGLVLLLQGCAGTPETTAEVRFKEFPIGVYSADAGNDAELVALKKSGVNLIHTYGSADEDHRKILDAAQRHGMRAMLNLDRKLVGQPDGVETMRRTVRLFKDHPALGFWYLYDEPAKTITPDKLRPFYRMLKEEAPTIPVAMAVCWDETFDRYSDVLDIQMADIYPVRDEAWPEAPLQVFSNFIRSTRALGKPVIAVPQTMSWRSFAGQLSNQGYELDKFRYPNEAELRYMLFSSLAQGVHGIVGYSYYHAMRTGGDPGWWNAVCAKVLLEVKDFTGAVDDPARPTVFRRAADGNQMASYWKGADGEYIMLVNAWPLERRNPGCWLEETFRQDYNLVPWGSTRPGKAWIRKNKLRFEGVARPWEVFIWKLEAAK